ncbi:MAG: DNA mismatch repair protein MutS [Deltaproteobacteria bacterium]|nr:DNA mismatch repair protein MutS [Deltaproteobacteria bacterium]
MSSQTTPMMRQYLSVKEKHRDAILFFRLGDFYEMFFEDAEKASKLLDLTLTSRNKNQEGSVPLCGIPVVASQGYIQKLLALGHKIAICEQTEDPALAKGIVRREVVQVLTPGLVLDPECLEGKAANYLAALCLKDGAWGIACADITTGAFKLTELKTAHLMQDEILRLSPREILTDGKCDEEIKKLKGSLPQARFTLLSGFSFDPDFGRELYARTFKADPEGLGLKGFPAASQAGSALLSYLDETKFLKSGLLSRPALYHSSGAMVLDNGAIRNLELLKTNVEGGTQGSLMGLLDETKTVMGSRLLKEWLLYPLVEASEIKRRQGGVAEFVSSPLLLEEVRSLLSNVSDLERIVNRVLAEKANARDLAGLAHSLAKIPPLLEFLVKTISPIMADLRCRLNSLPELRAEIIRALVDDPPFEIREGGLIREGYNAELDELRDIERGGKSVISAMEAKERVATGINSLKIRFNSVFGYYIEITHAHSDKVPAHYIRRQTLTTAERYITPELKEYEEKVLRAGERIRDLEYRLFVQLRQKVAGEHVSIKQTAAALSALDAVASLAQVALERRYSMPVIVEEPVLEITRGRHPVIEAVYRDEPFVPNDIRLNGENCRLMLITGPNMAGKSTVMRQAALTVIMAQMGGFVPAESARVGIVDRIFTRIGSSDHLQKGQSTFMVEMLETAHILAHATKRSLIILDEVGRGTSTFDGLSIAWALCETLHDTVKARTFFATHYHELTDLAEEKKGIKNFHMSVSEWNGEIRFLRELKEGGVSRSYGVAVAAMAGIPPATISRAREILKLLENKDLEFASRAASPQTQPSLFEEKNEQVCAELKNLDLNSLTPLEALNWLASAKKGLTTCVPG